MEFNDISKITTDLHLLDKKDVNRFNKIDLKMPKTGEKWHLTADPAAQIVLSLCTKWDSFKSFTSRIFQGIITGGDKLFVFEKLGVNEDRYILYSQEFNEEFEIEKELLHPFLRGSNIKSYFLKKPHLYIFYPYKLINEKTIYFSEDEIKVQFPHAWNYLKKAKNKMNSRGSSSMKYPIWYALWNPRDLRLLESPKILVPTIAAKPSFGFDNSGEYFFLGSGAGGPGAYGLIIPENKENPMYVLGLLNSILTNIFINATSSVFRGGYRAYSQQFIWGIPFRPINFNDKEDVVLHDKMVELVKQMLQLNTDINTARTPQDKELIQRQIDATDKQINKLVYGLYDLTEDEINIVEDGIIRGD